MLSDRLNALKKQHNLSNAQWANLSGVPVGTINRILSGATENPSFQTIVDLCTAVGVTVDALLYSDADASAGFAHPAQAPLDERMVSLYEKRLEEKDQRISDKDLALHYRARWLTLLAFAVLVLVVFLIAWLIIDLKNPTVGWYRR